MTEFATGGQVSPDDKPALEHPAPFVIPHTAQRGDSARGHFELAPYYADDAVTLYLGDCRDVLPSSLAEQPVACVTDPPYAELSAAWDRWPDGWVKAVAEELPESASLWCFGTARMFLDRAHEFAGWRFAQEALWVKRNGTDPSFRDQLAERLIDWWADESGVDVEEIRAVNQGAAEEYADALLPLIDARVQAAANQRAAEAWDEGFDCGYLHVPGCDTANPHRAALAQPGTAAET